MSLLVVFATIEIMKQRYFVAIMPPSDIRQTIQTLQLRYRVPSWHIRSEPHITLYPPFSTALTQKTLLDTISQAIATIPSFPIILQGIGTFKQRRVTVFAHVKAPSELTQLHEQLQQALGLLLRADPAETPFQPHLTLSNRLTSTQAESQLALIRHDFQSCQFDCQEVTLLAFDFGRWQDVGTARLA